MDAAMTETVDVRCLPYMPLQIERLRKSKAWLRCKRRPELAFYIMNLWMRAWHELPSGSIEADDDVLADAAMCDPITWETIKADVLTGWTLRDGRWHHPVVEEIALEASAKLRSNRKRTESARAALSEKRPTAPPPASDEAPTGLVTEPLTDAVTVTATGVVTGPEGKGREEKGIPSLRSGGGAGGGSSGVGEAELTLDEPPEPVPRSPRGSRLRRDWRPSDDERAYAAGRGLRPPEIDREAEDFRAYWCAKSGKDAAKLDWSLTWQTWVRRTADRLGRRPVEQPVTTPPGAPGWPLGLPEETCRRMFLEDRWHMSLGPEPGYGGCKVPRDVQERWMAEKAKGRAA